MIERLIFVGVAVWISLCCNIVPFVTLCSCLPLPLAGSGNCRVRARVRFGPLTSRKQATGLGGAQQPPLTGVWMCMHAAYVVAREVGTGVN